MTLDDFNYDLPPASIAQTPIEPRDAARMLVVRRGSSGAKPEIEHRHFYDLPLFLTPNDVLARNDSRVLPARLFGTRVATGAKVEFMLVKRLSALQWQALCKPAKRVKTGEYFVFSPQLRAIINSEKNKGLRELTFECQGVFEEALAECGTVPLPPYIHEKLKDPSRYQTVYAKADGSAAAPTAGLHFTPELLSKIQEQGTNIATLTLHVGLGTFRPVAVQNINQHKMHAEYYHLDQAAADLLNSARNHGGRIIAVGTTTCRVLETCADANGRLAPQCGETSIFINPGYTFRGIDALITNFHLPKSTLLMLVSAFMGRERALEVYKLAVEEGYRFFSFGDCMLIL
ncbi:MAG: tRNA preQ1(34) S-adenosylmethionine ribosyltransferase-isomerase QueA [Clostridia bacterium]|nr:tRNA preQ1(34) S-adenosylmethionine ribosyltransferase-isomerase QueA [Clostridia bacterium]